LGHHLGPLLLHGVHLLLHLVLVNHLRLGRRARVGGIVELRLAGGEGRRARLHHTTRSRPPWLLGVLAVGVGVALAWLLEEMVLHRHVGVHPRLHVVGVHRLRLGPVWGHPRVHLVLGGSS